MMFVRVVVLSVIAISSSLPRADRRVADDCGPTPPSDAVPATAKSIRKLAGRYRLFSMDTVNMMPGMNGVGFELQKPDRKVRAEHRALAKGLPGSLKQMPVPTLVSVRRTDGRKVWDRRFLLRDRLLIMGCEAFTCTDANPIYFGIIMQSPRGFWGRWNDYQQGMAKLIDPFTRKRLANPAGYFCALREPNS